MCIRDRHSRLTWSSAIACLIISEPVRPIISVCSWASRKDQFLCQSVGFSRKQAGSGYLSSIQPNLSLPDGISQSEEKIQNIMKYLNCLLYTSPSPRDRT